MDITFDQILSRLKLDSQNISNRYRARGEGEESFNFIDIDKFLDVLYSLLESNNYLLNSEDDPDPAKFLFTEEYPDLETEERNVITYEIVQRSPAKLSADADPFKGTSQYRPTLIREESDGKDGGRIAYLQSTYDNRLRFRCWSKHVSQARRLTSILETILNKYYYVLRRYVPIIVLEGRGNGRLSGEYADNRYMGIPVDVFVRTNEVFSLKEQEIKNIHVTLNGEQVDIK